MKNKKRTLIMILSTVFTVILSISFTYAFFYYGKEGSTITLESGSISLKLEEDANFLTLHDTYPKSEISLFLVSEYNEWKKRALAKDPVIDPVKTLSSSLLTSCSRLAKLNV